MEFLLKSSLNNIKTFNIGEEYFACILFLEDLHHNVLIPEISIYNKGDNLKERWRYPLYTLSYSSFNRNYNIKFLDKPKSLNPFNNTIIEVSKDFDSLESAIEELKSIVDITEELYNAYNNFLILLGLINFDTGEYIKEIKKLNENEN